MNLINDKILNFNLPPDFDLLGNYPIAALIAQ